MIEYKGFNIQDNGKGQFHIIRQKNNRICDIALSVAGAHQQIDQTLADDAMVLRNQRVVSTFSIMQNADQNEVSFDQRVYTVKNASGEMTFEGVHKQCMAFMREGTNA